MGFLSLFAVKSLGISTSIVGLILSVGIFANSFSQTPMGIIADKYNKAVLIIIGGLIGSLGYFYMAIAKSIFDLIASRLIVAVGGAVSLSALTGLAAEEGRELGAGSTMGVFNSAMSIGQIAGPIISGVLLDLYNMQTVFNFGGIMGLIGVIIFCLLVR